MGFYIRKSISFGPFRFNLSKSGVGVSVGVRGFRVGSSPRGNYVHMGVGGIYYRATLPHRPSRSQSRTDSTPAAPAPLPDRTVDEMLAIESASTATILDSSSAELVAEMNAKRRKIRLWPLASIAGIFLTLLVLNDVNAPLWWFPTVATLSVIGIIAAAWFDRVRKTTILMYEIEPAVEQKLESLHAAFQELRDCSRRWHVGAEGRIRDPKYHGGASAQVRRVAVSVGKGNPPYVKTNVATPSLPVGRQTLYFFPDKVLVFEPNAVGAVSYETLLMTVDRQPMIEKQGVPRDAKVVEHTWEFVNRDGGPDRRFKNNRKWPVALYEQLTFSSDSGLNEVLQVSRLGVGEVIHAAIRALARAVHPAQKPGTRHPAKVA